jgi:Skp family chaperone for outer membrane proteins
MGSGEHNLTETIARHEREIADLRAQVKAIQDGHVKEQLEAQIAHRISELEADLKLQEMQESMVKEQAGKESKERRRRFPWNF